DTAYVAAFAFPTLPYMGTVVLHFVLGLAVSAGFLWLLAHQPELVREGRLALPPLLVALVSGQWLAVAGNLLAHRWVLWVHVVAAALGLAALLPLLRRPGGGSGGGVGKLAA